MYTEAVQRLRVTYAIDGAMRYLSVLDMGRLWERLLRRAGLPLAYTQGFNPHPRLAFAAPLPVGYSSQMELLDLYLGETLATSAALARLVEQSPAGLQIGQVDEVALEDRPLQAIMQSADYTVALWSDADSAAVQAALDRLLVSEAWPWQKERAGRLREFDLRALIIDAHYVGWREGAHQLQVTMVCSSQGSGRPEDMVAALDVAAEHWTICRTALHWTE